MIAGSRLETEKADLLLVMLAGAHAAVLMAAPAAPVIAVQAEQLPRTGASHVGQLLLIGGVALLLGGIALVATADRKSAITIR